MKIADALFLIIFGVVPTGVCIQMQIKRHMSVYLVPIRVLASTFIGPKSGNLIAYLFIILLFFI